VIPKRRLTGDVWTDAHLLRVEERMAEARARAARRAVLGGSRPPRGALRARLGALLLAVGHRLLGSTPASSSAPSPSPGGRGSE